MTLKEVYELIDESEKNLELAREALAQKGWGRGYALEKHALHATIHAEDQAHQALLLVAEVLATRRPRR